MLDKQLDEFAYQTAVKLRRKNLAVELDYLKRSVKAQMREANRLNTKFVLFIGGDEYKEGNVVLKNMKDGNQINLVKNDLNTIIETIVEN